MKISFIITSTGWGGLEMNTLKLAKSLRTKGFEITLITRVDSSIFLRSSSDFDSIVLINKSRFKYFNFISSYTIYKALKEFGIGQVMVFDNRDIDVIAWTKKIFFKSLVVIYQQHMQIGVKKRDLIHSIRFSAIDYWICPLNYLRNEVIEKTRFAATKIKVIPIGTEVQKFVKPKLSKEEARKNLNISSKCLLLGIIGRISEKKGQLFVIESIMKLREKGHNVELLIYGSPTINDPDCQRYYDSICAKIKENNLENIVHFIEHKDDTLPFYCATDVFVLASHGETYGMVTIEAMLTKTPVIATRSDATMEMLDHGRNGLLFDYKNHEMFCEKFSLLIKNKMETERMINRAYIGAIEKYDHNKEVQEVINILIR